MTELTPTINGNPVENKTEGLIRGEVIAIPLEIDKPNISWHGAKFPKDLYNQTVAFAKYCNDTYNGEVQGRLFYSASRDEWKVCVLPQYVSRSLESKEIPEHKDRTRILASFDDDWIQDGTWHSHANATAFQSGTDLQDEVKQSGIHYTVGRLTDETKPADIHARYMFRTHIYQMEPEDLLEDTSSLICECLAFPDEWLSMLEEKVHAPATTNKFWGNDYDYTYDSNHELPPVLFNGDNSLSESIDWSLELSDTFCEREDTVIALMALMRTVTGQEDLLDGIEILTNTVNDILDFEEPMVSSISKTNVDPNLDYFHKPIFEETT